MARCSWSGPKVVISMRFCGLYIAVLVAVVCGSRGGAVEAPSQVPTVVVRGFDQSGASRTGMFGVDLHNDAATDLAATLGLPTSDVSPFARNQVAYTDYYGTQYPPYYNQQDIDELTSVTAAYGGGVPRYALIIAKFVREVMARTGAKQVNLLRQALGGSCRGG